MAPTSPAVGFLLQNVFLPGSLFRVFRSNIWGTRVKTERYFIQAKLFTFTRSLFWRRFASSHRREWKRLFLLVVLPVISQGASASPHRRQQEGLARAAPHTSGRPMQPGGPSQPPGRAELGSASCGVPAVACHPETLSCWLLLACARRCRIPVHGRASGSRCVLSAPREDLVNRPPCRATISEWGSQL